MSGLPPRAGVGLKAPHYRAVLERRPDIGFFEVHAENYMGAGGPPHRYLSAIREHYPLSLHGVGLSIGAARPLDRRHLRRLRRLLDRYQPALFSEHLAWSSHGASFLNDLLPLPYTGETLRRVARHIDQVQEAFGRQMLLENPSTYLRFAESSYFEADFIAEIVRRTGCALLLDVNNLHIACTNHAWDVEHYLARYPLGEVREIHLAGHLTDADDTGRPLLVDTHDRPVAACVWDLYQRVLRRVGPIPTLVEWDAKLTSWEELEQQAHQAQRCLSRAGPATHAQPTTRTDEYAAAAAAPAPALAHRQREFATALLDREAETPAKLMGPDGRAGPRRFGVYRNNVLVSLIESLQASFPVVQRLVGAEFFAAMAAAYVAEQLPRTPLLLEYGRGFPAFIAGFAPASALPYLSDVARIERAWLDAYHAPEAEPLDPRALARVPPAAAGAIRFIAHPSLRLVRSRHPVFTIWSAHAPDAQVTPIDLRASGESVLLVRPAAEVQARIVPADGARFLQALLRGGTLAAAAAAAAPGATAAAAPRGRRPAATFDLAAHLRALLDCGAFQGFSLEARPCRPPRRPSIACSA